MILSSAMASSTVVHFFLSAYLISNIYFFTFVKTALKTTRNTTVRCLQLLCCRTLELTTNYLLFPLSLIDARLEQSYCFLIFRQPQTKSYIPYISLHCFLGNICQIQACINTQAYQLQVDWILDTVLHKVNFS